VMNQCDIGNYSVTGDTYMCVLSIVLLGSMFMNIVTCVRFPWQRNVSTVT
jgi:hypothetical protein